MAMFRPGPH